MGCTNSRPANPQKPMELAALTATEVMPGRDRALTSPHQLSPTNTSSRFRTASSIDVSAIKPSTIVQSDLDLILDFYKLPEIMRYVLHKVDEEGIKVTNDTVFDCNNLCKRIPDDLINSLYPAGDLTSSSVIRLASRENASDKFLEMIENTYKGTQRTAAGTDSRRVTLIYRNGTSKSLIFNEAWKYWFLIRAIKRSFRGVNTPVIMDCLWLRHSSATANAEKSFWGFKGSKPSASDAVELTVEVSDGLIRFGPGAWNRDPDSAPPETPVGEVLAISLACDYSPVRTLILEVSFLSHTWDHSAIGGAEGSPLCIEVHHSGRPNEVPVTFSDIGSRQFLFLNSTDLVSNDKIVLKVMTDNTSNNSGELFELGKHELLLNSASALLRSEEKTPLDFGSPISNESFSDCAGQDIHTLPSLTPFHSFLPAVPLIEHVVLSVPDTRRMYKLVLHSAVDVLGGDDDNQAIALRNKLNIYAVVELYTAEGKLLSPSNYHRTEAISSSLSPQWEAEFNFPLHITELDVASILVRIKDGSGYLRHKTIGQVCIPTSVFVSVSEMALLRLPIDAVDMISGEVVSDFSNFDSFGMLSIGTQTCPRDDKLIDRMYGGFVETKSSAVAKSNADGPSPDMLIRAAEKTEPGDRRGRLVRQMSAAGQATVSFCFRELSVSETCWPFETLATIGLDVTFGGSARRNSNSNGPIIPISFGLGHLFTGANHLVALPSGAFDNSLMRWCAELDPSSSLLEPVLRIPWGQVKEIDTLTDTSLMLTVILHRTSMERKNPDSANGTGISQGMEKFRQSVASSSGSHSGTHDYAVDDAHPNGRVAGAYQVDILVAPCPSVMLGRIVHERVQLSSVRSNVKSFLKQYAVAMMHRQSLSPAPRNSFSFSSAAETLSLAKSVFKSIEQMFVLSYPDSKNSIVCRDNQYTGNYSPADIYLNELPAPPSGATPYRGSSRNLAVKNEAYAPEYATEGAIKLKLRLMIMPLMEVCSALKTSLPGSKHLDVVDRVKEQLLLDEASASEALFELNDSSAEKTTKMIDFLSEASLNTLREAVLCGWDGNFPDGVQSFVDALVLECLRMLRRILELRLGDAASFERLDGFTNKTSLVKYVLENNNYFCSSAHTILGVLGLSSRHLPDTVKGRNAPDEMLLLNKREISNVISLYSNCVINETRMWLSKTLLHYLKSKTNKYDLPWDVEIVGSLYLSPIPETLRFQLNAFMSVCYVEDEEEMLGQMVYSLSAAGVDMDARGYAMLMLNESVVKSILLSLHLVAEEYKLSLQRKHWDDAGDGDERGSNLAFLVSVGNDCHRILQVHVPDVLRIKTPNHFDVLSLHFPEADKSAKGINDISMSIDKIVESTAETFHDASATALKCITRLVFSDLTTVLFDFDNHWLESHDDTYDLSGQPRAAMKFSRLSKNLKTSVLGIIPGNHKGLAGPSPMKSSLVELTANPVETIILTLSDYFRDLKSVLGQDLFLNLLAMCAHVCVVRYLIFLRQTAEQVQSGTLQLIAESFITAVEADISTLNMFFATNSTGRDMPKPTSGVYGLYYGEEDVTADISSAVRNKLDFFKKIVLILRAGSVSDVKLQTALRELALTYGGTHDGVSMVECLLQCCAALRPSSDSPEELSSGIAGPSSMKTGAGGSAGWMQFPEMLLDAWAKQLSGARRQSFTASSSSAISPISSDDLPTDVYFAAFHTATNGNSSDIPSALKGLREKAVNGDKRKKDVNNAHMMKAMGLIDPDKYFFKEMQEGIGNGATAGDGTPGVKRRFSATDSLKAAAAFLNTANGSSGNAGSNVGDHGFMPGILEWTSENMISSEIFPSDPSVPVIDIMIFNIKTKNVIGNPYIVARLSEQSSEQKTKAQKSTGDDTVWTDEIVFRGVDAEMLSRISLDVRIYDKGIRGKKLIGGTEVKLSVLDVRRVDSWFALSGGAVGSNGEIHLSIMKRP